MADTNYNQGGFTQGSDGGVYGDPSSGGGSVSDYDTWDWKQIMAAINGGAAEVENSENLAHARSVSDPATLQNAANVFLQVQLTLQTVGQSLADQAKALAGDNGPWKGVAADAFLNMMNTFSRQILANADMLSGGSTGLHSVPQQLANNGVNLSNGKDLLRQIDSYYANQAVLMGVQPMSNGLIPISQKPQLVDMMTNDMRKVLKSLAAEYQVTIDTIHSPPGVTSPISNPNTSAGPNPTGGGIGGSGTGGIGGGSGNPGIGGGIGSIGGGTSGIGGGTSGIGGGTSGIGGGGTGSPSP
ncbi:WXG100 family type VII secretion target, partial [Streptomyces mirabilis]